MSGYAKDIKGWRRILNKKMDMTSALMLLCAQIGEKRRKNEQSRIRNWLHR